MYPSGNHEQDNSSSQHQRHHQQHLITSLLQEDGMLDRDDVPSSVPLVLENSQLEQSMPGSLHKDSTSSSCHDPEFGRYGRNNSDSVSRRRVIKMFMENVGHCLAVCTFLGFIIGIPVLFFCMAQDKELGKDYAAFYSAGLFVMLTLPISMREIIKHLTNWYMPEAQKYVVRILWMVPLYSINSWLSLRFHEASLYIDTLRDFYEAFVLISFFYYLVELLGGEDALAATLRRKDSSLGEHPPYVNKIIQPWNMGIEFLSKCKTGVLQYVVLKTAATLMVSFSESIGVYGEGKFHWYYTYPYIATVTNFSQMYALYCLVKFYFATESELKSPIDWHPVGKFLCIKGVIFFTWWQGVLIAILENIGVIDEIGSWNADDVAQGLQDYLVCIEMFLFAIAHSFTFTFQEYVTVFNELERNNHGDNSTIGDQSYSPPSQPRMSARHALWSSAVPTETMMDIHKLRRELLSSSEIRDVTSVSSSAGTTELSNKGNR